MTATGFGTAEQQRAYIRGCLASGATADQLAEYLGIDAETVRRIAAEADSGTAS